MIENKIVEAIKKALIELDYPTDNISVVVSNRPELADYQYNGVFSLAKELHNNPIVIGEEITNKLNELNYNSFSKIEFAKPGFINFTLSNEFINEALNEMLSKPKFNINLDNKDTYVIDYGGPNIAKPLHVGHLRSAIIGESIKRILLYAGNKVISDVHLGDYGLQIGQVIYGLKKYNISIDNITLDILEKVYPEMSGLCKEDEEVKKICEQITKDLQDGNKEYNEYFKKIRDISGEDILRIYRFLDVNFDLWYGESDSYKYLDRVTDKLNEKGLLYDSQGAKVVDVKEDNDTNEMPPFIFQKSNGAYLYSSTDLATIEQRMEDYNPTHMLYVTDLRQHMHFESLFRVAKKMGYDISYEHLGYGTVNGVDGKPFKTRKGDAPKLDDLFKEVKESFLKSNSKNEEMSESDLDIITNAIIKYADLQNNREKDYIFDISKFSEIHGKTGPYLLYTYLRINKILNNEKLDIDSFNNDIYNAFDRDLRIKLLNLCNVFNNALNSRMPSVLGSYLFEVAMKASQFYEANRINGLEDKEKKDNWLLLLTLTNKVLKEMLNLLIIDIPTKM